MEFWSDEKEYPFIKSSPDITPLLQYSIDPWNNYAINNRQSTINNSQSGSGLAGLGITNMIIRKMAMNKGEL
jgi:hypothetical protein